ncbi:hypothetical protein D3C75_1039240 [compost metagenome]
MLPGALLAENFAGSNHDALGQQALEHPAHIHRAHGLHPDRSTALGDDHLQLAFGMFVQQALHALHTIEQHAAQHLCVLVDATRGKQLGNCLLPDR